MLTELAWCVLLLCLCDVQTQPFTPFNAWNWGFIYSWQYTYRPEHLASVLDKSLVDVLLDNSDQLRYAILHELRMRGFSPFNNRFHVRYDDEENLISHKSVWTTHTHLPIRWLRRLLVADASGLFDSTFGHQYELGRCTQRLRSCRWSSLWPRRLPPRTQMGTMTLASSASRSRQTSTDRDI